ncbi:M81 family metallopeptidase [Paeniroseomonas aquatica]|uniref:Microcystinase C n=1 Tax=Paeniroseomonas aquatica TaxID=373043 RepID=A0ABT8ADK6_9PROT|nr:M81 family metallopeptidase [Paeniroseomonas aquatica]MDN3567755.1 M81 family metallopeptidase [Paeniroseomonas aquatica]
MRVALLGFSIECNRFAPAASQRDFDTRCWVEGEGLVADARSASPRALGEMPGFVADMDAAGPWEPLPILLAMAEPNGPVEHAAFARMMVIWREGLEAIRGQVAGVYCVLHGAGLTTELDDPEGALQGLIREVLGPVPLVCSYDLHANVSEAMVRDCDAFVGYRTNPHLDMRERGAESAQLLRRLLGGERARRALVRLPIVAPTVSMLTAAGPYAEVIDLGQELAALDPAIWNVSVMGGFAYGDTPFNGMAVVVTAADQPSADSMAERIARAAWARRDRFVAELTPLREAVARAKASPVPLAFADVADNPGGGGRGNTMHILAAFLTAGVEGCLVGVIHDPLLAEEAHRLGRGARFTARFNRPQGTLTADDEFSRPLAAEAEVVALSDGRVTGRRGIYGGTAMTLGATAALRLGGITVVVISIRTQCADPAFFEHLGLDIGAARSVVVKSRGHFRGGFDEFFGHDRIIEVDAPGLTSPILSRFAWTRLPRPVLPLDEDTTWTPKETPKGAKP